MKTFYLLSMSLFILPICFLAHHWGLGHHDEPGLESGSDALRSTFSDDRCTNPCWLGIEVGVSDRQVVETNLATHQISYSANGPYTYNLFLDGNPSPLWQNMARPVADIHLDEETVRLMTFAVNLCPSTILNTYGHPQIVTEGTTLLLLYPDRGLRFNLDTTTLRVASVALYPLDFIDRNFPLSERQDWTNFEDLFYRPCIDSLSQNH